jgi:hypothetical protein
MLDLQRQNAEQSKEEHDILIGNKMLQPEQRSM